MRCEALRGPGPSRPSVWPVTGTAGSTQASCGGAVLVPRLLPRPNCFSSSAFARTESSGLRGAEGDKCVKERTKSPIPSQSGRGAFLGRLEGRSWPGGAAADSGTPPSRPPCPAPRRAPHARCRTESLLLELRAAPQWLLAPRFLSGPRGWRSPRRGVRIVAHAGSP